MNRANKLPKAYKSRIILDYIEFPLVGNRKYKNQFIRRELTNKKTELDTEITDAFLDTELEKMGTCSDRDLKNLSHAIYKRSVMTGTISPHDKMIIKKATMAHVINQYVQNKSKLDYDAEDETDEERQNRHHKENLDMQQSLFAQQQMIQLTMSKHQKSYQTPLSPWSSSYISDEGEEEVISLISDEQKQLLKNRVKKTNTKKQS